MAQGALALILHAHLPYVRHPEREDALEERWLFEAITESYIPLLSMFQRLIKERVAFRVTLSLSPTLLSMLSDPLLQKRTLQHLDRLVELAEKEMVRTHNLPDFYPLAKAYKERFQEIRDFYLRYRGDLIQAFRELRDSGHIELITTAATHAFLPLVLTEEGVRAQVLTGIREFERHFGERPRGMWLPECGYFPGLDRLLAEQGIGWFVVDSHGVQHARPRPDFGNFSPVVLPTGVAAFSRDTACSEQVWSSKTGYPGDVDYREYYRDIGFDLDLETIGPYIHPTGIRHNTGIKYYRITGEGDHKEPYNPQWAREKAAAHAGHFLHLLTQRVWEGTNRTGRQPIITVPFDAELFGHWWYEGPLWIEMLLKKMHYDQVVVKATTPSEYLSLYTDYPECQMDMSTWGRYGYADVWLREENDWIYPALHKAEVRMSELASRWAGEQDQLIQRVLKQAARELMLAQSSDWAFIMDGKTAVNYAVQRTKHHINRFWKLEEMLTSNQVDETLLETVESLDALFPDVDIAAYRYRQPASEKENDRNTPRVLMLSWEFPPMTVGGLSRHVYDLSRYLVRCGWEVHVITTEVEGAPHEEIVDGVHVHRVHVVRPFGEAFIHWVAQLNLMMVDAVELLIKSGYTFDVVHAHDWLVEEAATTIKHRWGIPMIATIHATEHGRNHGIHTDLQHKIHHREWRLTYEAQRVIVCSRYMKQEVETLFQLPQDKLDVIPNGVDPEQLAPTNLGDETLEPFALPHERVVLFIGRLVREKGVDTLLTAAGNILARHPDVKFVIAGKGPMMEEWKNQAKRLGYGDRVLFAGFVSDEDRNRLLRNAAVTVFPSLYEPFGIVALEAMTAGSPVVVSDVGGLADVVEHGQNGLKMYAGDARSLATQVNALLDDPVWAQQLAEAGRQSIKQYDWSRIAQQTITVYQRVLGKMSHHDQTEEIPVPSLTK
ncbi:1,4-alpha-glucan branching protein domain-containing protein [Polycladomyces subterraneus]|uniref:DUF1957 domain-containing protein n=1 Tax=Polycladomyces subterraneus TaxID=1016997 RepID=A0ABT8IK66_9BACL|nr:1,4-alpha-glucan branching protein domain-containing protein [Polycladomyces subterraneus]MDN4593168.1 DUF1957 domain-containing protein [Polycladomyces subterraneus]